MIDSHAWTGRRRPPSMIFRDIRTAIRHTWWRATGERERVLRENAELKAWGREQMGRARAADHALFELKVEHRPYAIDVLLRVADEIDCGQECATVSPMDWSTGVTECRLSDRGECAFDKASQLRDLARALVTHEEVTAEQAA